MLGAHEIGTNIGLPRNTSGWHLRVTRLSLMAVETNRKAESLCAIDLSRQLRHLVPSSASEIRNICPTIVSDFDVSYWSSRAVVCPPPPLSRVLREAAALTSDTLKYGKIVYIKHFYVFLFHTHTNVLKGIAKQHEIWIA